MEGWFDAQIMDFIHSNAELIPEDEIDTLLCENGGHEFGCHNYPYSRSVAGRRPKHAVAATQQISSSSSKSTGVSPGASAPGGTCTGDFPGDTCATTVAPPGGEDEFAHVPAMPVLTTNDVEEHRHKHGGPRLAYNAAVARPVGAKEIAATPLAQKAINDEWTRLRAVQRPDGKRGCWDEEAVMEWRDVKRAAQLSGTTAHIGGIFAICVEKNSELEPSKRKYKGRAVFGGDQVRDEAGNWAIFQDLGSCPATMDAARAGDAHGCLPGHA